MEAAIRWSPQPNTNRFLLVEIADSRLALHEAQSLPRRVSISHQLTATADKLPAFNAFAISPISPDLVALGLASGNASIYNLSPESGSAGAAVRGDILSKPVVTYRVKQQRKCNSIAISSQSWLAVAWDKTRSDVCLNIFDTASSSHEPVRRLCNGEACSSVRFFPSSPQEVVTAVQRSFIRLYDLRNGYGGTGNLQTPTKCVNNIAIDPRDENYFAGAGSTDDPTVTVWDKRRISSSAGSGRGSSIGAVLELRPAVSTDHGFGKTTVWSLRYSGETRGRLGMCSSAGEVKVVDIASHVMPPVEFAAVPSNVRYGGEAWTSSQYVRRSQELAHPVRTRNDDRWTKRVVAFDWLPSTEVLGGFGGGRARRGEQDMIVLRADRTVEVLAVGLQSGLVEVTGRDDLAISAFDEMSVTERPKETARDIYANNRPVTNLRSSSAAHDVHGLYPQPPTSIDDADQESRPPTMSPRSAAKLLQPLGTQRDRCKRGYLFDPAKNMDVLSDTPRTVALWRTIRRFQALADIDGMVAAGLDLSYLGVTALWSEVIGFNLNRRLTTNPTPMSDVIIKLCNTKHLPPFEGERTDYPEHRQLCLTVCGWKFTVEDLETECNELVEKGRYYIAIVQAVLHGYVHIALNLLRTLIRSHTIANIGLGPLLASTSGLNEEQKEMCLWMTADTDDTALKALLTYLYDGDWKGVMHTSYLNLTYRVAMGLKYLTDTEISNYINSETARTVRNGDLEGVLLTGLSERAVDLFSVYVAKTNDLQTAVLAMGRTAPVYVDDMRFGVWKEMYLERMQMWRCFMERTRFVVQHNRLATDREGRTLNELPRRQITLKCLHCNASLARPGDTRALGADIHTGQLVADGKRAAAPAAHAGTECAACGRHMPRCGICLVWLSAPGPSTAGGAKGLSKEDDLLARLVTWCASCGHGFHAHHAKAWFARHGVCAVPDCSCACGVL